ncbi:MAG: DUF389 domain-containing protein [Anaerolineales bacterium]
MRQMFVQVPRGNGAEVMQVARAHEAINVSVMEASGFDGPHDLIVIDLPNDRVENILNVLQELYAVHVTLPPQEVIAFKPPPSEAPRQMTNVQPRSPIEIFLAGLQSIGTWKSFLIYAVAGAVVTWIAFFTNTVYLLIAAMLIAPFAGPAMNLALATASGDRVLFRRNIGRYLVAIATTVSTTAALTWLLRQDTVTAVMVNVSQVSSVAILLPLVSGVAGALNLVQSERSSLVSGTAVGILVSASLAPPAGLLGMALVMGLWDVVMNMGFVLLLQLVGINIGGAVIFRLYGITYNLQRYDRGQRTVFLIGLLTSAVILAGLLTWQFSDDLRLQRSSEGARAAQLIEQMVRDSGLGEAVEVNARFTAPDVSDENILITDVIIEYAPDAPLAPEAAELHLRLVIEETLQQRNPQFTPLVSVDVRRPPP